MENKALQNTNNKLIDLMGICLSQELLQTLHNWSWDCNKTEIANIMNGNNVFVQNCFFGTEGKSKDVLERVGRYTALRWMVAFLKRYTASTFNSDEIPIHYYYGYGMHMVREPAISLPRALGCSHESFAKNAHRLLLGREDVPDQFEKLSPLDQKKLFGIISGTIEYIEAFIEAYPNTEENEESKGLRQSLTAQCKEFIEFIKTHLKREDIFLRNVVVLTAQDQLTTQLGKAYIATETDDYKGPSSYYEMAEKAYYAIRMSEEANYDGDIESLITKKLNPDLFLQFIHTVCHLYSGEARIGAGKLHFSPDENVNVTFVPSFERGYANELNRLLGINIPFFQLLCSGDQHIIYEEFDHSIRRVDEIYTRLMEDPSYSGVKERWKGMLSEMKELVATMQVEMEAANSTTDQTGVKRGGKVSN